VACRSCPPLDAAYRQHKADNRSVALDGLILGAVSVPLWITFFVIGTLYWW
jgi:hypothetical protein